MPWLHRKIRRCRDVVGNVVTGLVSGKLHPESIFAESLSDDSRNILQVSSRLRLPFP